MEALTPSLDEVDLINEQRAHVADNMAQTGSLEADILAVPGPCSPDLNRMPNGELAAVHHDKLVADAGRSATSSLVVVRYVAEKPRTTTGPTGILHEPGGARAYLEGARQLHEAGVPFASEVISDASAVLVVPHLAMGWVGAREVSATGPRYNVRPTDQDRDRGIHPLPVWVKNDQDGDLGHTVNALRTILSDAPQARTRFGMNGYEEVVTYGNPHVGAILRGQTNRPAGETEEILINEIGTAREMLDREFGVNRIPIMVDVSHAHAKYEGGGEEGQLAIAQALGNVMMVAPVEGWMAETYILPGKQSADGTVVGLSITDPCIRQEKAEQLLLSMDASRQAAQRDMLAIEQAAAV